MQTRIEIAREPFDERDAADVLDERADVVGCVIRVRPFEVRRIEKRDGRFESVGDVRGDREPIGDVRAAYDEPDTTTAIGRQRRVFAVTLDTCREAGQNGLRKRPSFARYRGVRGYRSKPAARAIISKTIG